MKEFLICCLFGSTANSLVRKIQLLAEKKGHPLIVSAVSLENSASVAPAFDGSLVTPHIQYKVTEIKGTAGDARPIAVIKSLPYTLLDAEEIFAFVMAQTPELVI